MTSNREHAHQTIQRLVSYDNVIFVADGTKMLGNVEDKAVCVIFEDSNPAPGDARFYAHVEDLKDGGSDGWYGVVEELSNNASVEDLKELFSKGKVGDYGEVYKDTYGLAQMAKVTFRLPVHATSEFGDAPEYTNIRIGKEDLVLMENDIENLKGIGFDRGSKALWMTAVWEDEKEYRLRDEALTVTDDNYIWASAHPKHADYEVETQPMNLEFVKKLHEAALDLQADTVDLYDLDPRGVPSVSFKKHGETLAQDKLPNIYNGLNIYLDDLIENAKTNLEPDGPR